MKHLIKFNNEGVGKAIAKNIKATIPETYTDYDAFNTACTSVDDWRNTTQAQCAAECIDHAEKLGMGNGEGNGISVANIPLGGHALGAITIDPNFKMVASITYKQGDVMDAVLSRSNDLFTKFNVAVGTEEEVVVEDENLATKMPF